jgi:hypothetical protein
METLETVTSWSNFDKFHTGLVETINKAIS